MTKFYDTSSLLLIGEKIFDKTDKIVISSITLQELEHIKTSTNKDSHIKYLARNLLHLLDENSDKYTCYIYKTFMDNFLSYYELDVSNDTKILATASFYSDEHPDEEFYFITNDIALKMLASLRFEKSQIISINENPQNDYLGYLEIQLEDEEIANFYSNPEEYSKQLKILPNQYLNIYNIDGDRIDTVCWTGEKFRPLKYKTFSSHQLGNIKPWHGDIY